MQKKILLKSRTYKIDNMYIRIMYGNAKKKPIINKTLNRK